ncbi:MAG: hypothetical protein ACLPXB_11925, partial [Thiobacillaceae bacterium]
RLAEERDDLCGMTQLASRSVATPFVGALAATLVLSEVVRPMHEMGGVHPTIDLQMKTLHHRTGHEPIAYRGPLPPYVNAANPSVAAVSASDTNETEGVRNAQT